MDADRESGDGLEQCATCQGSITIVKTLHPSDDPGKFNLEIDGSTAGGATAVGDGGTTGTVAVGTGKHTVGESAAAGTKLAKYDTQIVCSSGGAVVAQASGATVQVVVKKDADVVCTITNTVKEETKPLVPKLECVIFRDGAPDQAVWGYQNDSGFAVTVPVGADNSFTPGPAEQGPAHCLRVGNVDGSARDAVRRC